MSARVALILPVFPVLSETFIVRQWLGLLDRGWDVHVVCQRFDSTAWRENDRLQRRPQLRSRVHQAGPTHSKKAALKVLPANVGQLLRHLPSSLRYASRFRPSQILRRLYLDGPLVALQSDLLHFEFGSVAPARMDLGEHLGARTIVSFRGFDLNYVGLEDKSFYDPVWQRADALHLLGEDLWRRAQARGCPVDKKHALIPPAVDAETFTPATRIDTNDGPLRISSIGRLEWKKGYEYGLRAARLLADAGVDFHYTLVGGGSEWQALAYARHQLGLEDKIRLTGPQSHGQIRGVLAETDVFLHPAVSEGFCNAVLEAQSMELPVVTTDADGLGENVADGETGFVVERRDPQALADKLKILAEDPELRRRLGRAGRRRAQEHFRPDQELDAFEKLYGQVLNGTSA